MTEIIKASSISIINVVAIVALDKESFLKLLNSIDTIVFETQENTYYIPALMILVKVVE